MAFRQEAPARDMVHVQRVVDRIKLADQNQESFFHNNLHQSILENTLATTCIHNPLPPLIASICTLANNPTTPPLKSSGCRYRSE